MGYNREGICSVMREIDIHDFFDGDWAVAVQKALSEVGRKNCLIRFQSGVYNFYPDNAYTEFTCISNHSGDGERPFAFPLYGCENIKISGEPDTLFLFNGNLVPFLIETSKNIKLENFSIDWQIPFYSQGIVKKVESDYFDLALCEEYEGEVKNERFFLRGQPFWGAAEMDCKNKRMLTGKTLNFEEDYPNELRTELLKNGLFRIHGRLRQPPDSGSLLVLRHGQRDTPAIFADSSENIRISKVSVYHAGGMGVIAQNCKDIKISEFAVKILPGSKRFFSICADAVHMVNCSGNIIIENSLFENQFDDAVNIHGVYSVISKWISPSIVKTRLAHRSQKGLDIGVSGNKIRFVKQDSLQPLEEAVIKETTKLDLDCSLVKLDRDSAVYGQTDIALENLDWRPDLVEIRNCVAQNNNPRGFLISTGGKIIIDHNFISVPGAAIRISGDACSWYESGLVDDVIITNNTFKYCNYDMKGSSHAVIDIVPEIQKFIDGFYYHKNIKVTNNIFADCCSKIIYGWSFENLIFEDNQIAGAKLVRNIKNNFDLKHFGFNCRISSPI